MSPGVGGNRARMHIDEIALLEQVAAMGWGLAPRDAFSHYRVSRCVLNVSGHVLEYNVPILQ